MKKIIANVFVFWVLALVLSLFMLPTSARAEQMYQISETELTRLESNLTQLASINSQQLQKLKEQKSMLSQAKFDLEELQDALKNCRLELQQAQSSLQTANELLKKYENAERQRRLRIKRQRNFAYTIATGLAIGLLYKQIN